MGGGENCLACIQEQAETKKSIGQRIKNIQGVACSKHGDPRILSSVDAVYMQLYILIRPHCTFITYKSGSKDVSRPILNLEILRLICDAANIDFFQALNKMEIIHDAWTS